MMKNFLFLMVLTVMSVTGVVEAYAESPIERTIRNNEIQRKRCNGLAERIGRGADEQIRADVLQYRFCYPYLDEYTPFSKDLVDEMTRLAFLADTTKDPKEAQQNLVEYKRFVRVHTANLDVAKMAFTLSKQNPQFGNPVLFKKVISILQDSIIPSGRAKGVTPESAYYAINYGEENFILSSIGGKLLHSEIYAVGNEKFYNAHDIEDTKTGKVETYFVDITIPIKAIEDRKKIQDYLNGPAAIKL